jgi:hydrogenase maturation protease
MPKSRPRRLVVGLGAVYRGDDAVGPTIAAAVRQSPGLPDLEIIEQEDPTLLIETWVNRDLVVVADAVRSGAPVGTLHVVRTGPGLPPIGTGYGHDGSTHEWGLASALELARAMDRMPKQVVVVGIEVLDFTWGAALTPAVAEAIPVAVREVLHLLSR